MPVPPSKSSMNTRLAIEEIRKGSDSHTLGYLEGSEMVIGRDKTCPLSIDNAALSRQHGVFQQVNGHWIYRDLGSTNGSWLNGQPVAEGQWRLIRAGDLMQIADIAMRIIAEGSGEADGDTKKNRSLLVFTNGIFLREVEVPSSGVALRIGSQDADLPIETVSDQPITAIIERIGLDITVSHTGLDGELLVNDEPLYGEGALSDRDALRVQQYTVILNDPDRRPEPGGAAPSDADDPWADDVE